MTVSELRETAYRRLQERGVRHPMPDQVVAEMRRIESAPTRDLFDRIFRK